MTDKMLFQLGLLGALALAPAAQATSLSASGGDGAVGVHADTALLPTVRLNVDWLRTDHERGDAKVYSAGLMVSPPTPLLHWGVGARYRYQDSVYGSGGGVELGAQLFIDTPIPLLSVGGYGYYMPSELASGDVRESHDYGAQLRLGFTRSIYAWAGYRDMRVRFDHGPGRVLYKGPAVGLSVGF